MSIELIVSYPHFIIQHSESMSTIEIKLSNAQADKGISQSCEVISSCRFSSALLFPSFF